MDGSTRSSGVGHGAYPRRVSSNENSAASNEFVSSVGGKSERERESSTSSSRDEARSDSLGPRERGRERESWARMLENRERMGGRGKSGGRRGFQSERERGRDGGGRVDGRRKGSNEIGEKERERNGREDILSLSLAS